MRVYPSGMRVTSSNLDPFFCWQQGAQMVALNWQRCDKGTMLNAAMFADSQGWVMKPRYYRDSDYDGHDMPYTTAKILDFSIEIFAAQQLPMLADNTTSEENFHPYVKCQLHVCRVDPPSSIAKETFPSSSAKTAKDNKLRTKASEGFNPNFGGEKLVFQINSHVLQELSFLRSVRCVLTNFLPRSRRLVSHLFRCKLMPQPTSTCFYS